MNSVLLHLLILWAVIAGTLGAMFIATRVRVKFSGLRPTDTFAFVGATFGIVIGLTTFFASEHYSDLRGTAEAEATSLSDFAALSGSFPPREGGQLRAQLLCYATDVIDDEWATTDGLGAQSVDGRVAAAHVLLLRTGLHNPQPESWYTRALSAGIDVGDRRDQRLRLTEPQIPGSLWFLLYVGSALSLFFVVLFHLANRAHLVAMILAVSLMLSTVFAVLAGLDSPTQGLFSLKPKAMTSAQTLIAQNVDTGSKSPKAFCDGLPVPSFARESLQQQ
jgi:hypothetical protein